MKWQYSRESLHNAFMNLGIVPGDIVLVHSDIFMEHLLSPHFRTAFARIRTLTLIIPPRTWEPLVTVSVSSQVQCGGEIPFFLSLPLDRKQTL